MDLAKNFSRTLIPFEKSLIESSRCYSHGVYCNIWSEWIVLNVYWHPSNFNVPNNRSKTVATKTHTVSYEFGIV